MLFEKDKIPLSLAEFEKLTGAKWLDELAFESEKLKAKIKKKISRYEKGGKFSVYQRWLGVYFEREILEKTSPKLSIRWIDDKLGWGVFAEQDIKRNTLIAEYTGTVRKRTLRDKKNAYCFEYLLAKEKKTPYTIDALNWGNISRYINHSNTPNCVSALATLGPLSHILILTAEFIPRETQLCYDYGEDYWASRKDHIELKLRKMAEIAS